MGNKKADSKQLDLFSCQKSELQALWQALAQVKLAQDSVKKRLCEELQDLKENVVQIQATQSRILTYLTLVS